MKKFFLTFLLLIVSASVFAISPIRDGLIYQLDSFRIKDGNVYDLLGKESSISGTVSFGEKIIDFNKTGYIDTDLGLNSMVAANGDFTAFIVVKDISRVTANELYGAVDGGAQRFYFRTIIDGSDVDGLLGMYNWNPIFEQFFLEGEINIITAKFDNGNGYVYKDGVQISSTTGITASVNTSQMNIGARANASVISDHSNYHFSIFNRAMTDEEIKHQVEVLKRWYHN